MKERIQMNMISTCLFGGALLGAGLSNPTFADINIAGTINAVYTYSVYDYGSENISWTYGSTTLDTWDFTVLSDGQVQLDVLSWDQFQFWIDSNIYLFVNDGNPLSIGNYVDASYGMTAPYTDLNNSLTTNDSFLDIFLNAGDYTVVVAAFETPFSFMNTGISPFALLWADGGVIIDHGDYELDIFGDVQLTVASCAADFTGDGVLDFFDVSAFLTAFASQDPVADFTGDTLFDFFDVSAFLSAFGAGCP